MAAMRRADIFIALTLFVSALALAPLIHTHVDVNGHQACSLDCPAGPRPHVHFPGDQGACPADGANHADRDHTSQATKLFHLLANLTTGASRIFVSAMAVAPVPVLAPPLSVGPVDTPATLRVFDPPSEGPLALRGPPA